MKIIMIGFKIVILLSCLYGSQSFADSITENLVSKTIITVKNATPSDTSLRTGTENWEQEQSGFFIFPAIVLGLVALFVFYKRD